MILNNNNNNKYWWVIALTFLPVSWWNIPYSALAHEEKNTPAAPAANAPIPIGGTFMLTDQNGKTVKDTDFRGKPMLVFFGYTHCPDICPVTVATLSKVMEILGKDADGVAPVFITVDPKRDTPAALKEYLSNFDKRLVGLTGKPKAIQQAADAYKVYFSLHDAEHPQGKDYAVDHSTIVYMMNKDGSYAAHFPYHAPAQEIADAVKGLLK